MSTLVIFFMGMLGALAPEIVRLYTIRSNPSRFRWSWFYSGISLAFAALGGALAVALPATTLWGAIYVGASTPIFITTMVKRSREAAAASLKGPPPRMRAGVVDSYLHGL